MGPFCPTVTPRVMSIMRDAGVPILAGTDMDSWYKRTVFGHVTLTTVELPLYATEGLTPWEAPQTAMLNPAKMLHAGLLAEVRAKAKKQP